MKILECYPHRMRFLDGISVDKILCTVKIDQEEKVMTLEEILNLMFEKIDKCKKG